MRASVLNPAIVVRLFVVQRGFTLIEILVALLLFTVLSTLSYEALTGVINYNQRTRVVYEEQNQLHRTSAILMQDLLHLRPRPIRDRLGGVQRAYYTGDADYEVQFTRGGLPSVQGSTAGGLQRVAYSVSDEQELLRWTWPTLDSFTDEEPRSQVLMVSVSSLAFYQLNAQNEFEENWPPLNETLAVEGLPRMIRFEIELESGLKVERLMPGVQAAPSQTNRSQANNNRNGRGDDSDDDGGGF